MPACSRTWGGTCASRTSSPTCTRPARRRTASTRRTAPSSTATAPASKAAYREYQLSPDTAFLEQIWPGVKKAVDWLIEAIDKDHEGMPTGHQTNTYDCAVSGRQHVHRLAVPVRPGGGRADGRW